MQYIPAPGSRSRRGYQHDIASDSEIRDGHMTASTPLHWAVYKIDAELVSLLLQSGAEPDVVNSYGSSPLSEAVKTANLELVEMLLAAGADAEVPNQDGQTALMLAARVGSLDIAKLLVAQGADVNARENWRGQTALIWAVDSNAADVAAFLIEQGANVNIRAAANDWGAQITSEPRAQYRPTGGLTPLLYAARSGCTACVQVILDAGAEPNQPNPDGVTPLIVAIENFAFDAAILLLDRGANPNTWDWWGRTPLYAAVDINSFTGRAERSGAVHLASAIDVIESLLSAGVNPNPQLNMHRPARGGNLSRFVDDSLTTGATPLLRAAIAHDNDTVRALLDAGAHVDLPNVMGITPLMGAAGMGVSRRDRRIGLGGNVEARAIETLQILRAAGADINARVVANFNKTARIARPSTMTEREGQTALYGAIKFGWAQVAEYLISNGAMVDIVDAHGKTPLDAATGNTGGRDNTVSEEIAAMLRAAGAQ